MEILKQGANGVRLLEDITKLLDDLRQLQTPQQILDALLAYAANPNDGVVADAVARLNLNQAAIQSFINDNQRSLTFLLGDVGTAAKQKLSWPVATDASIDVNAVAISLEAAASAAVFGDTDGDLFGDGAVTYAKETEAFLNYEIEGKVEANANVPAFPIGSISAKAAFGATAGILVGNYFRHGTNDRALNALIDDVRSFRLPYSVDDLRPNQYVRLHGNGSVAVSGELSFGKSIVASGEVSAESLGVTATPISADVKFAASLGFNAEVSGDFDILISREAAPGRVRVQLVRLAESKRGVTLKAGVGATIKGVDQVASSIVSQITTPLAPLVKLLQEDLTQYGDLQKLFLQELSTQVDGLLNDNGVVTQIQAWLTQIGSSADLKSKLKEVITNAVDAQAGPLIDDLQNNLTPVVDRVKQLIKRYQDALAKVNKAIKAAAEIKIGIDLAHKRSRFETNKTALDLSIDPSLPAYRKVVHGDFSEALELARQGNGGVTLNDATWSGTGGIRIESSISVSAFGRGIGSGSLLSQDWEWELTASGDLSLGVKSSIQAWGKSWRALRSVTFLADIRVLAVVSRANQLLDPQRTDTASLELGIQWAPPATRAQLAEWEQKMVAMRVLAAPTGMTSDLALSTSAKQPYGNIIASGVLDLTEAQLETIADQPLDAASAQFVNHLTTYYLTRNPFSVRDADGALFLQWDQVRQWAARNLGASSFSGDGVEFKSGRSRVAVAANQLLLVLKAAMIVTGFEKMLKRLQSLRTTSIAGLSPQDAINNLAVEQRRLMRHVADIVAATDMGRENLGRAFFMTLWDLAGGSIAIDPYVVILRKGPTADADQRVVYV